MEGDFNQSKGDEDYPFTTFCFPFFFHFVGSDEGLTLGTSALKLFSMVNLRYQLS